ncbi:glycoside hydrolase family 19 protein [Massilia sp. CF038]|uniref:glycoside hydrolase family 19 protein n=1 Tax=Massilia sp. CF038 TaxID=1881045 RepID=UPI0009241A7A|nr:glycoside hydrolase family 19 protein [Massilia sp. CF038]SHH02377.1 putative chitinase [Massilia sp. CF038]
MAVIVSLEQINRLAPDCGAAYRAAFAIGQPVLAQYAIAQSPLRVAHFFAQILHETGALTLQFENLNYSARRLREIWPARFRPRGPLNAARYAYRPQKLANAVYGGRLGNVGPNDGYVFRGRGLLQLTGKDGYAHATTLLRQASRAAPDLTREPDAVVSAAWCLQVAAAEWQARGCNEAADLDDVALVTRLINGGSIGLAERIAWTGKTRLVWPALEPGFSP